MAGRDFLRFLTRAGAIFILVLTASGCVAMRPPVNLTTSFDAQAAAFINAGGRAKVSGQAFVRQNNGKLLRAVGTDVVLIPKTAYADERIAALYGDRNRLRYGVDMPDADPLYEHHMRRTVASSGGSFSFDNVADGQYYVIAMIHLPGEVSFRQFPILERVNVVGGKSVRLVMRGY